MEDFGKSEGLGGLCRAGESLGGLGRGRLGRLGRAWKGGRAWEGLGACGFGRASEGLGELGRAWENLGGLGKAWKDFSFKSTLVLLNSEGAAGLGEAINLLM